MDDAPGPTSATYQHWGLPADGMLEPNSRHICGVATYSQSADSPTAFGWSDADCAMRLPFMCKRMPRGAYVYISPDADALSASGGSFEVAKPGGLVSSLAGGGAGTGRRPPPAKLQAAAGIRAAATAAAAAAAAAGEDYGYEEGGSRLVAT